ncbi:MAG: 16S rRNA (adenine1518-N6/adenine1519-N6)-dimethyltransferase [Candidatus Berkelbacteria bacterium Gr01-1014_85]|uniref:Ribosomal RNA small subunit methyltransferase A n=1 Tax=Candidatus Berkelbacteria bacterium Gr01-1014_85 TaxID=2017150 RepID=A0A554JCG9_9BACT|nr:MAG: 16S rRNA (adenine1518-N6/adenine1519-N6)-dimethyltransferase [Candidatus Berkelbacteria bacterium Gr01-1014_85]
MSDSENQFVQGQFAPGQFAQGQLVEELNYWLSRFHLRADKRLGQHYLVDQGILDSIIAAAELRVDQPVVEIGAGPGVLTAALARAGGQVLAIEFDQRLVPLLRERFNNWRNVSILASDALRLNFAELPELMVSNLPYQITNPIFLRLVHPQSAVKRAVLMIQAEVAERFTAPVGSAKRGQLTVMLEATATLKQLFRVPPEAFRPAPAVMSAVIELRRRELTTEQLNRLPALFWLIRQAFASRRKILLNSLMAGLALPRNVVDVILEGAEVDGQKRAEDLTVADFDRLLTEYLKYKEQHEPADTPQP